MWVALRDRFLDINEIVAVTLEIELTLRMVLGSLATNTYTDNNESDYHKS